MASQDYPLSAAERMRDRKDNFMDSLIEYSSSGRFVGQDSEPPTPRIRDSPVTVQRKSPYDLVTAEDFLKNLPPAPLDGTNGYGKASENPKRRSTSEFPQNGDGKDKDKTGTLRRIRGMVKTKSISLGLSKGPVDGTSPCSPKLRETGMRMLTDSFRRVQLYSRVSRKSQQRGIHAAWSRSTYFVRYHSIYGLRAGIWHHRRNPQTRLIHHQHPSPDRRPSRSISHPDRIYRYPHPPRSQTLRYAEHLDPFHARHKVPPVRRGPAPARTDEHMLCGLRSYCR